MEEAKIKLYEFIAKYIALALGAIWTLILGTDFIDKRIKETDLAKAQYELNTLQLGKDGLYPKVNHELDVDHIETETGNIYGVRDATDNDVCNITGRYEITNIGAYPIKIDTVTIEVYAKPIVSAASAKDSKNGIVSFSLSPSIESLEPILKEEMVVEEMLSTTNKLQRSFGYLIHLEEPINYVISVNATGGLVGVDELPSDLTEFHENDLRHLSAVITICPNAL